MGSYYDDLYDSDDVTDYSMATVDERIEESLVDDERINLNPWWNAGFATEEAGTWAQRGFTVDQASKARAFGFTPERALGWVMAGYEDPDEWVSDPDDEAGPEAPHPDQMTIEIDHVEGMPHLVDTGRTLVEVLALTEDLDEAGEATSEIPEPVGELVESRRSRRGEPFPGQLSLFG